MAKITNLVTYLFACASTLPLQPVLRLPACVLRAAQLSGDMALLCVGETEVQTHFFS
jgi:hypothetical protein